MMTSFKSTILSRASIPRESHSTYYHFIAKMKASISTSSCMGLVLVTHSARAFIQGEEVLLMLSLVMTCSHETPGLNMLRLLLFQPLEQRSTGKYICQHVHMKITPPRILLSQSRNIIGKIRAFKVLRARFLIPS